MELRNAAADDSRFEMSLIDIRDGLGDIFAGFSILVFGLGIWADMPWMLAIFPAAFLPLWQSMRKRLIEPRLPRYSVQSSHLAAARTKQAVLVGVFFMTMVAGLLAFWLFGAESLPLDLRTFIREYFLVGLGLFGAFVWMLVGLIFQAWRFFLYAGLTLVSIIIGHLFQISLWTIMASLGAMILLIGIVVFIRFLMTHPKRA
jgi:hypothetical protein